MPLTILDDMTNAAAWQALAPDGVTPSTEISLAIDTTRIPPGNDASSAQITASTAALNHLLRRSLGPVDLTAFDEVRVWINADRLADGTAPRRFYLEMRLGSAAMAPDDPANTWQRYLPVSDVNDWEPVRLTLGDLPAVVRGALTIVQLRCVDASSAFHCNLDDLIAVRDAMIGDVDNALLSSLNGGLILGGAPIPAVLHPAEGALAQAPPYIEILHLDTVYSRDRTDSTRPRGDFNAQGYSLRPPSNAYELYYQVTAVANDRPTQAAMLEFILRTLPARGQWPVNGQALPMETVYIRPINQIGGARTDRLPLFYKVSTRQEVGTATSVLPARSVVVNTDTPP
jgi:hypothetical protein